MADSAPYITLRKGEEDISDEALVLRYRPGSASLGVPPAAALRYPDERPEDRDHEGILYARVTQSLNAAGRPVGQPIWPKVHPSRQRECMGEMLCHYCKGEPSHTAAGTLFLDVVGPEQRAKPDWPEGSFTFQPPLCLPHAKKAVDDCGHGHRHGGFTGLRVLEPRWHGVLGTPYQDSAGRPKATRTGAGRNTEVIPFNHPHKRLFLGTQYALALHDVTVVDLAAEFAAADLT
ncbi:hypothetical protein [Streptomyces sp. CA-111067]|uniref:hypothetical protein n=1 Tax=Streptomyces sp. CA-111067 TaxID=3240046 RepID=UPI003D95A1E1